MSLSLLILVNYLPVAIHPLSSVSIKLHLMVSLGPYPTNWVMTLHLPVPIPVASAASFPSSAMCS